MSSVLIFQFISSWNKKSGLFFFIYTLMKLSGQLVVLERVKASKKCVVCTVKCFVHLGTI